MKTVITRTAIFAFVMLLLGRGSLVAQHPEAYIPGYPGAPVRTYFQPVRIQGPEGTKFALATNGKFVERKSTPHAVGLLLGGDYRLRITDIPLYPGEEVFPTVKIIDRTYPPQGREWDFPIPIEITQEDIELALNGKYVTRVIYLEDPTKTIPVRGDLGSQLTTEVSGAGDPMDVAATLGKPVAIVRLGGRLPNVTGAVDPIFFHGCPPWMVADQTTSGRLEFTQYRNTPQVMPVPVYRQPSPTPVQVGGRGVSRR